VQPVNVGVYSIGAVARMLGVPPATLRTWEQRYGVITPERSDGRHRLYSRDQVESLRFVAQRVAEGMSPGDAHRLLSERKDTGGPSHQQIPGHSLLLVFSAQDPYGAAFAEHFLRIEGYDTTMTTDVTEGQRLFADDRPRLVVIDLLASAGTGADLCRLVRRQSAVPILAVSALADLDRALSAGASAFLPKPLDAVDFIATVKDLLGMCAHPGGKSE
jgi:CheY-like chemotaxis protein